MGTEGPRTTVGVAALSDDDGRAGAVFAETNSPTGNRVLIHTARAASALRSRARHQAHRDFEILAKRAAEYPQEMVEFQSAVLALPRANQLARDIRITPRQLHDEGGGAAEAGSWAGSSCFSWPSSCPATRRLRLPTAGRPGRRSSPHRRRRRQVSSRARVAM